jgi:hypothetical protein
MAKLAKAKPIIVKVTMVKLFIIVELFMAKIAIIKLNMAKNDGITNCG